MTNEKIESDVVYDHEKYGDVLVTGIAEMHDEWYVNGYETPTPETEVLVFFYDNYDGFGGMNPMPLSEPVEEFARSVERQHVHDYEDRSQWENTKVDPREERNE